jgi:tight adherence protein B
VTERRDPHDTMASLRAASRAADLAKVFPLLGNLERLLAQAGASASIGGALLAMAACSVLSFVLLRFSGALPPTLAALLAGALGVGLPVLYLILCRAARRGRFEEQLPEALDLITSSLRAGETLGGALAAVARKMPDPLGAEFGAVVDEIGYGRAPDAALARLEDRLRLPDLRYLTLAVQLRSGADGNLAAALDGLAKAIREQLRMRRGTPATTDRPLARRASRRRSVQALQGRIHGPN